MSNKHLQSLLSDFAKKVGIKELALNEDNNTELVFDDNLIVIVQYIEDTDNLNFIAKIAKLDENSSEKTLTSLLAANLFGLETAGGVLALDEESLDMLYTYSFNLFGIDFANFNLKLNRFVKIAEHWQTLLSTMNIQDRNLRGIG